MRRTQGLHGFPAVLRPREQTDAGRAETALVVSESPPYRPGLGHTQHIAGLKGPPDQALGITAGAPPKLLAFDAPGQRQVAPHPLGQRFEAQHIAFLQDERLGSPHRLGVHERNQTISGKRNHHR